jgi:hypothetical protein
MSKILNNKLNEYLNSGQLLEIVDRSLSNSEVLRQLGYSEKGQYVSIIKQFLIDNEVDFSHFTSNGKPSTLITKICLNCNKEFNCIKRPTKEQQTCSRSCSNTYFRSKVFSSEFEASESSYRKLAFTHYRHCCNRCGFNNVSALEVHHIDRNRANNNLNNLEILCANCHSIEHTTKHGL